jgi:hypothetical protein
MASTAGRTLPQWKYTAMSRDITTLLEGWEYEPDEIIVRVVPGDDGKDKIQMRVDMGLLQMELDGRPDGARPEDCESWLDYYEEQQRASESSKSDAAFALEDEDCFRLWREGVQYYQRYLSLWHLKMFERCARDTQRNMRLFAFVRQHAQTDRSKFQFDQWRPYVIMMHARAVATPMLEEADYTAALQTIEEGIEGIRRFLEEYHQSHRTEECLELKNLEQWRDEVLAEADREGKGEPARTMLVLEQKLRDAVADERFEEAARLRDEIRRMTE